MRFSASACVSVSFSFVCFLFPIVDLVFVDSHDTMISPDSSFFFLFSFSLYLYKKKPQKIKTQKFDEITECCRDEQMDREQRKKWTDFCDRKQTTNFFFSMKDVVDNRYHWIYLSIELPIILVFFLWSYCTTMRNMSSKSQVSIIWSNRRIFIHWIVNDRMANISQ